MDIDYKPLIGWMSDPYKGKLTIPPDQRQYVWGGSKDKTVEDFIDSIYSKSQFFGTILAQQNDDEYFIWDGQQRIITITIIVAYLWKCGGVDQAFRQTCLASLYRLTEDGVNFNPLIRLYGQQQQQTLIGILQDCLNGEEAPYKFKGFIEGTRPHKSIMDSYKRIKKKVDKEMSIDSSYITTLKQNLKNARVLNVGVIRGTQSDNCPSIFRALNSAGLKLTDLDLTKQFLFQILRKVMDNDDIYDCWSKIANNCKVPTSRLTPKDIDDANNKSLNDFFKIYAGILGKSDNTDKYFKVFESHHKSLSQKDINKSLQQIMLYSNIYHSLKHVNFTNLQYKLSLKSTKVIRQYIDGVLYSGRSKTLFSYLPATLGMLIFKYVIELQLQQSKIVDIFTKLINTHIRLMSRKVHGGGGSVNRYCTKLCLKLQQQNLTSSNIVDIITKNLLKYQVEDEEIIPHIDQNLVPYILIRINMATRDNLGINQYTIEHVMPKTRANTPWEQQTSTLSNGQYEAAIKSIGNLVLIPKSLNSKLSNKGFKQKLGILTKVENDIFTNINKDLYFTPNGEYRSTWSVNDINDRANNIINKINTSFPRVQGDVNE